MKLGDLAKGSKFTYEGQLYEKGSNTVVESHFIPNIEHPAFIECHPYLNGKIRSEIEIWLSVDINITLERE